jgi:hypothetical protein
MATQVQLRRGNTSQTNAFTGAVAEITIDTDKETVVVHDGATAGGFALARESAVSSNSIFTQAAFNTANAAFASANITNGIDATQNNTITAAFLAANAATATDTTQNNSITAAFATANAAFTVANNAVTSANGTIAWNTANASYLQANAAFTVANAAFTSTNGDIAFATANSAASYGNSAFVTANSAGVYANSAFLAANTPSYVANSAASYANSAFARANNSLNVSSGGSVTGAITASGNVTANSVIANNSIYSPVIHSPAAASKLELTDIGIVAITVAGQSYGFGASGIESNQGIYGGSFARNRLSLNNETNLSSTNYDTVKIQTGTEGSVANEFVFANNSLTVPGGITANGFTAGGINVVPTLTSSFSTANAAFTRANNSLNANTGGTVAGDLSITGNLTVTGLTTYTNTTTVLIADNIITVNAAISQSAQPAVNAGIEVDRGAQPNSSFLWIESSGKWAANNGNGSIFIAADSAETYANSAFAAANAAIATDTTQNNSITAAFNTANASFTVANNAVTSANGTIIWNTANAAFLQANTPNYVANSAAIYANAAFTRANNSLNANTGGTIAGQIAVDGGAYGNVTITQFAGVYSQAYGSNPYSIVQVRSSDFTTGMGMQAHAGFHGLLYSNTGIQFNTSTIVRDKDYPTGGTNAGQFAANGAFIAQASLASTSNATGSIQVVGGIGVKGNVAADGIIFPDNTRQTTAAVGGGASIGDVLALSIALG